MLHDTVLATLGGSRLLNFGTVVGYGVPPMPVRDPDGNNVEAVCHGPD